MEPKSVANPPCQIRPRSCDYIDYPKYYHQDGQNKDFSCERVRCSNQIPASFVEKSNRPYLL